MPRRDHEEDEDIDDRPRRRRRDDDDDDDEPRPRKTKKNNTTMVVVGSIAAVAIVLILVCGGVVFYMINSAKQVANKPFDDFDKARAKQLDEFNKGAQKSQDDMFKKFEERNKTSELKTEGRNKAVAFANKFLIELKAGRVDNAYQMTTASFQGRVTSEQFSQMISQHSAGLNKLPIFQSWGFAESAPYTLESTERGFGDTKIEVTVDEVNGQWKIDQCLVSKTK